MHNNELDKTFVERSPAALIPPVGGGGHSIPLPNSRPIVGQTRLGSSLVTEVIGEGGMATVYKVWNERLEVFRAVKLLSQGAFSARFETEAKIIAKLHHEGIVEVHNISEWNGMPYMEMEFVDGSDLQKILAERGRLPEAACVAIAILVAEALSHAHTKTFTLVGKPYCGIIHRDLKPANIMISNHGAVKLTDFGIARPTEASIHTIEGNIAGTMHYLSPEQMDGIDVDNRSDIYSFGTILYEMITGAKTFPQESITELMKQKSANKFKPLNEYGIPINAELVKIILRCLKFVPAKRYQSTQDLVGDLQKLNESLTAQVPRDILKNYFSGTEDTTDADSGKTKTRWIFGKLKTAEISAEQEPSGTTTDEPENMEPAENVEKTETVETPPEQEPLEILSELEIAEPRISAKSKRMILIASLLLFTVFSLSYITIRIVRAKSPTMAFDPAAITESIFDDTATTPETDTGGPPAKSIAKVPTPPITPPAKTAPTVSAPATTPSAEPPPAAATKSEREHLRDALAASNARQWNLAVAILEQDGVYKTLNNQRTLYLFNAYVESRRFDRAQAIMDTTSLTQDAYFLLCAGKFWRYRGFSDRAIGYFESSLTRASVVQTRNVLPYAALFFIAEIKHDRFKAAPTSSNHSAALEAWRNVRTAFASKPNDSRAKRAEREISALNTDSR
ncbi:MAG: serine/threonine protein kinase [Chitinispirillales bacterium]|jgi:serine/threonine protein kinase|nr:serine/threonine protein kinase [Chitinispirillales bacterium]